MACIFAALAFLPPVAGSPVVGYEFLNARAGEFSLLGLRLHENALAEGTCDVSGSTLFDPAIDFDTVLSPAPAGYLVELLDGAHEGRVLELVSFALNTLVVADPLGTESGVSYRVRPIPRLSDIIPPSLPRATAEFNPDEADLVLLPAGGGRFDRFFVSTFSDVHHPIEFLNVYINVATGEPEDPRLLYTDAFFYLRRGASDLELVTTGAVKSENTLLEVTDVFNYFSSVYPVGMTLGESDLAASVQAGTADTADLVWIGDGDGGFGKYFVSDGTPPLGAGWRLAGAAPGFEDDDRSGEAIGPGFVIQRRAAAPYEALLTPPDFYSNP